MERKSSLRERLITELAGLRTVDCHSHTRLRRTYDEAGGFDLFTLTSYFERDLAATAGGAPYGDAKTDEERWQRLKPLLAKARNVSYWRHNLVVYRKLFGLKDDELDDRNWRQVNDAIRERSRDPGWYNHVTRDVCNLETQVRNIPWFEDWEPEYFTAVLRMESALQLHDKATRQNLERHLNLSIANLADAKAALARLTDQYVAKGAIGIKLAHAYGRTLHSLPVPDAVAAAVFARALTGAALTPAEVKDLQDHVIFFLAELCRTKKLIFQIHTGVQGNWGNVPDSDPLLLIPLLKTFPDVRFDLFHAGYPYSRMLGMLGKHYPNVWLNMAWMYVISIAASRQVLAEWLDLVPGYRILGFGSDVNFPEMIYGHLEMARACVADVLAEKVRLDFLSEEEAFCLARKMFRDNGVEFYGIGR
ncbi:MAG: hypothetical protein A3K19_02895 [Lentisphaerae bacterium RIFOXYB12_FULL_65_16]|nr:MAG: hypothetical protein A3K18_19945 [Lentisphaerae bacterium RIFOXYA12_64_32]OGV92299.1 MAG: hypothetical protein A3K19_02895 [Lentisphaerae bacterium RIFOXYB12_FULL_65_16]